MKKYREETQRVITKRQKLWEQFRHSFRQPHKFHKQHPFDCGNTQCTRCRKADKPKFKHNPDWLEGW